VDSPGPLVSLIKLCFDFSNNVLNIIFNLVFLLIIIRVDIDLFDILIIFAVIPRCTYFSFATSDLNVAQKHDIVHESIRPQRLQIV